MEPTTKYLYYILFSLLFLWSLTEARKHQLKIENDSRKVFTLSNFGFYKGGKLEVSVENFTLSQKDSINLVGFSLEKTVRDKFMEHQDDSCVLYGTNDDIILFNVNTTSKMLNITQIGALQSLRISSQDHESSDVTFTLDVDNISISQNQSKDDKIVTTKRSSLFQRLSRDNQSFPLIVDSLGAVSFNMVVYIDVPSEEGLYTFYFHNCYPNGKPPTTVNFSINVTEENDGNYLSAGEMPLPKLYFAMSTLFFLSGCAWLYVLRKSKSSDVFKLHYLMLVLVYVKSTSMLFHGMNFHFIQEDGFHMETWAVLYYVTHLLKGTLLFITLVLIGTGWAFIKNILSDRDKKIFMIVLSLQVLANVALIIMEESETGDSQYITWNEICILVDLLCCGAILFPVVWSIRHLQEASQVDGKAAINLRKLEMFRHFYIMIVCYIYFTRIIVYLLRITVPFQYIWLESLFKEFGTFIFFILTGYKFRPACNNPYLQVPQEDDNEIEMEEVLTKTLLTENLTKVVQTQQSRADTLNQESSHEYD